MIVKLILCLISFKSRGLNISITCLILSVFPPILFPQINNIPVGTRSLGMGSTYVALANSADAVFLNPGGLAQIETRELIAFYQKPFGLESVNFGAVALTLPFKKVSAGIGIISLSNGLLSEQTLKLAIGSHMQQKFYYGLALNYSSLQIKNYGSTATLGLDIGLLIHLNKKVRLGFQAQNLNRANIGGTKQTVPQSIKSGLSISPSSNLLLNLEVFKEIDFTEEIRFGVEYKLFQNLALRLGTASKPDRFSSGFGLAINPLLIDYAFFTHSDLGLTHQVSLSIKFGKPQQKIQKPFGKKKLETDELKPMQPDKPATTILNQNTLVNINASEINELMKLPEIGAKTASAIIKFRNENGDFKKKEDLILVPGIGKKKLKKILPLITVE